MRLITPTFILPRRGEGWNAVVDRFFVSGQKRLRGIKKRDFTTKGVKAR